jgi:hypothetical protein
VQDDPPSLDWELLPARLETVISSTTLRLKVRTFEYV